ncbi:MAG: hypothetical protein ACI8Q1_000714 [Parvicella sp.]|jgi:hypothetical protein
MKMTTAFSKSLAFAAICLLLFSSCDKEEIRVEKMIYFNDFEEESFDGLSGVFISEYFGTRVMGNYNNSGFNIGLNDLQKHDYLSISFSLYIHDSWDGNSNATSSPGMDHDAWILEFDRDKKVKSEDKIRFETTFSNGLCLPGFCYDQSYPREFPFPNDSREGAETVQLPGLCLWSDTMNGTALYKFTKVFPHQDESVKISFYDRLVQPNSSAQRCDESWSLDNLSISIF